MPLSWRRAHPEPVLVREVPRQVGEVESTGITWGLVKKNQTPPREGIKQRMRPGVEAAEGVPAKSGSV